MGKCAYCRGTGKTSDVKLGYTIVAKRGECAGYFCSLPDSYRGGKGPGRRIIYQDMHTARRGCWDCVQGGSGQD